VNPETENQLDEQTPAPPPVGADAGNEAPRTAWFMREPKEKTPGEERSNPMGLVVLAGLMALLWYGGGPTMVVFVLGLVVMIFLHELGHFMTARWTGMKPTQFFLGMGPRIWSVRRGEVEYGLRAIPAGAFVRILGMNNLDPVEDPADESRAYMNKSYPRRMLVITAGSMMHFIQAIVLFVVAYSVVGVPDLGSSWTIREISRLETGETPAVVAGLEVGDTIISANGVETPEFQMLRDVLIPMGGETVDLEIRKASGEVRSASVELAELPTTDGGTIGFLGVGADYQGTERLSPVRALEPFGQVVTGSVTMIPRVFSPDRLANMGSLMFQGPEEVDIMSEEAQRPVSLVGVVRIAGSDNFDLTSRIAWLAVINVSVGLLNLIPLLPLDGGHAAIATYERIRSGWRGRRPYHADVAKLMPLTYGVVVLLGFLFISTIWLDILRPIG
jgi:membrane-associated protease RseP (regulator of RpoE activity)